MDGDRALEALREMLAWKQQELARLRTPVPSPVQTVTGYLELWQLRTELGRMLQDEHDPAARLRIQADLTACDADITAAKADPVLAPAIRAWWLRRYE